MTAMKQRLETSDVSLRDKVLLNVAIAKLKHTLNLVEVGSMVYWNIVAVIGSLIEIKQDISPEISDEARKWLEELRQNVRRDIPDDQDDQED